MESAENIGDGTSFLEFNQAREILAQQFYEMVAIIGNQVFAGQIDANAINLMEEINRQDGLMLPEKNVLRQLHYYANNLLTSRFLLGVLGRFKSGKSTILNALAGADISPMDTRISTGVLNFTYRSSKEECHVVYDNGQESPIPITDKILYVDSRHNPDNEKGIHSVRHGSPTLDLQKEIVFVDTPGLEAVNQIHEKITIDFVSQCHAAVIVSTYPPFGLTELQFYERIKSTIPNVFLVQNLPADKLEDWIKLEAQTLENLYKLGFYALNSEEYGAQEVRKILYQISDSGDENALAKFKRVHNIHLFSINAKSAYEALVLNQPANEGRLEKLRQSRFSGFKTELYEFLAKHKGGILLQDYLQKGCVILQELIQMVISRQQLLRKSLNEISQQIREQGEKKNQTNIIVTGLLDHATVEIVDHYRKMKSDVMEKDLVELLQDLIKKHGQTNIYRLHKEDIKNMKAKVMDFNRLLGQRFQEFVRNMKQSIENTQEQIAKNIENHGIFSHLEIQTGFQQISLGEISGAGCIDYGFEIVFRGTLAYVFGALFGGSFALLLLPTTWLTALGMAIGLGLSVPLGKYCQPVLEFGKGLLSRLVHRSAQTVFEQFRNDVRTKLDEIEKTVLDPSLQNLKIQILQNTNSYFELFQQRLQELQNRKAHGMTQQMAEQECQKLQNVIEQLLSIQEQFNKKDNVVEATNSIQGIFRGIKTYLKKFRK